MQMPQVPVQNFCHEDGTSQVKSQLQNAKHNPGLCARPSFRQFLGRLNFHGRVFWKPSATTCRSKVVSTSPTRVTDVMNALPDMLDPAIGNATKVGPIQLSTVGFHCPWRWWICFSPCRVFSLKVMSMWALQSKQTNGIGFNMIAD